ncbi:DUF5134 domain-containing protein [Streptomyces winkii]|uniref:DUF5134 domain-containing protein n=1 Tax=Streptomyces winkii TaxID=3051178 RepID=UPI0028D6C1FF|nr:DUF5134 domain-containing protein [Streptomyces sp. DSM 40971]
MHGSATVGWLLTVLCALVAGVCLLRAGRAGGMRRRTARSEALMGLGMAAMALPGGASAAPAAPLVFLVLFGAVAVRELALLRETRWPSVRRRGSWPGQEEHVHHLHHLVGAAAMIYMSLAMAASHGAGTGTGTGGHAAAGSAGAGLPLLTGALLVYYAVYVLRTGMSLLPAPASTGAAPGGTGTVGCRTARGPGAGPAGEPPAGWPGDCAVRDLPGLAAACRVAMATGMLAMLLMM